MGGSGAGDEQPYAREPVSSATDVVKGIAKEAQERPRTRCRTPVASQSGKTKEDEPSFDSYTDRFYP